MSLLLLFIAFSSHSFYISALEFYFGSFYDFFLKTPHSVFVELSVAESPWLCWIIFLCFLVAHWVSLNSYFKFFMANWRFQCLEFSYGPIILLVKLKLFFFFFNAFIKNFTLKFKIYALSLYSPVFSSKWW